MRPSRLAAALALLLVASGSSALDLDEVKARGRLRVLTVSTGTATGTTVFFMSADPAHPGGIEYELLQGFAKLHKLELTVVPVPSWPDLIPSLLAGKGDLIGGDFAVSEARRKQIDFTSETLPTRTVIVTRKPSPPVTTPERLRTLRVGTVRGSVMVDQLLAAGVPADKVVELKDESVTEVLKSGQADARAIPVEVALMVMTRDPDLELGMYVGAPSSLAFGVRKGDTHLRDALSDYLANTRRTATWNRLLVKYLGPSAADILKKARAD